MVDFWKAICLKFLSSWISSQSSLVFVTTLIIDCGIQIIRVIELDWLTTKKRLKVTYWFLIAYFQMLGLNKSAN